MNTLITGGAGFIGSHLAARCFAMGHRVTVLDSLRTGSTTNLPATGLHFVEGCVADEPLVRKLARRMDLVFHLAARVGVTESLDDPEGTRRINIIGTETLVRACVAAKVRKLVFASSAAIYGPATRHPQREEHPPDPRSPYASSKLAGEILLETHRRHRRLDSACLRFFNVYGPRQSPDGSYASAIPSIISRALRDEPIVIHGDGKQSRDFIFVEDIIRALLHVSSPAGPSGIMNVGTGTDTSIKSLVEVVIGLTNSKPPVVHVAPRHDDPPTSRASIARLRASGWEPRVSLEDGLRVTLAEFGESAPAS
jgi:UDP-glucose 4-epimerase